jgi:hypothetical protein
MKRNEEKKIYLKSFIFVYAVCLIDATCIPPSQNAARSDAI